MAAVQYFPGTLLYVRDPAAFDALKAVAPQDDMYYISPLHANDMLVLAGLTPLPYPAVSTFYEQLDLYGYGIVDEHAPPGQEIVIGSYHSGILLDPLVPEVIVPAFIGPDGNLTEPYIYTWIWGYVRMGGAAGPAPGLDPIPRRRWHCGFEIPGMGEGAATGNLTNYVSRAASRTPEGFGLALIDPSASTGVVSFTTTGLGEPASPMSWERFYVNLHLAPSSDTPFWRAFSSVAGLAGVRLDIGSGNQVRVYSVNGSGTGSLVGTAFTLVLREWTRVDLLINFTSGDLNILVNGALVFTGTPILGGGNHASSHFGNPDLVTGNALELYVDDWHNAEIPPNFNSRDFTGGTHITRIEPTGFDTLHDSNWVGDWRLLLQNFNQLTVVASIEGLTSSTSGARLGVTTPPWDGTTEGLPALFLGDGAASMAVSLYSTRVGTDGQLGYSVQGNAPVMATVVQNSVAIYSTVLFNFTVPSVDPQDLSPVRLFYDKGASGSGAVAFTLMATIECLGTFGAEDFNPDLDGNGITPRYTSMHNAPYAMFRWMNGLTNAIDNPVMAMGGVYTGNNLGQDLLAMLPAHWVWVRPLSGSSGGGHWTTTHMGAHLGFGRSTFPRNLTGALGAPSGPSPDGVALHVAGTSPQSNVSPVDYQWIAFLDPAMRFLLNGAFTHPSTAALRVNELADTTFAPEIVMAWAEIIGSSTVNGMFYQGPGFAADSASDLVGNLIANAMSFTTGAITSRTPLHLAGYSQDSYSAWRSLDPSGQTPGSCAESQPVGIGIGSYVGDGTGARVIPVTLNARYPLFALVVPITGAVAYFRDPSHTTNTSSRADMTGATITTGITAGAPNSITVGSTLNANGVTYSYLVIPGSFNAWENGTFELATVCTPPGSQWGDPTPVDPPLPPEDCVDDWGTPRPDGLPYVPLMPPD